MRSFGIATVLSTALRVWKRNVVPFTLVALLIYAPSVVLQFEVQQEDVVFYLMPLDLLLGAVISATLTYGVVMELNGARPSFRDCVVIGFSQLLPVVGVVVVAYLGTVGASCLFVVPGAIVMMRWYVAVPVAIVEKLGVMASLRRSRELTLGHKGRLFLIFLLTFVVGMVLSVAMSEAASGGARVVVNFVVQAILGSFSAVLTAVIYTKLRHLKDGTSVPEIATAVARIR